jgi:hypothetical protein
LLLTRLVVADCVSAALLPVHELLLLLQLPSLPFVSFFGRSTNEAAVVPAVAAWAIEVLDWTDDGCENGDI